MEKFQKLFLIAFLVIGLPTIGFAIQASDVSMENDTAVQSRQASVSKAVKGFTDLLKRYETNLRTCEQIHLSQSMDLFGLKMGYKFDVNGWVDNKCSYYMTGNIGGLGSDIKDVFELNIPDETLAKIKPEVQCNFTQEQLDILIDGFIAAQERKLNSKLGTTEEKTATGKEKLSPEEEKMMQMLMSGQVCTVPNQDEVMKNFTDLLNVIMPKESTSKEIDVQIDSVEIEEVAPEKPVLRQDTPKINMPSAPQY